MKRDPNYNINNLLAQIPTRIKSQERIDYKRKKIIKGALSVFKRKGYHKTTVRDIAKTAKISMGSVYDCFEDGIRFDKLL